MWTPPCAPPAASLWLAAGPALNYLLIHQTPPPVMWQDNYWFESHTTGLRVLLIQSVSGLKSFSKRSCRASLTGVYLFSTDCFCTTIIALGWREHSGDLTGPWWTAEQHIQQMTRSWKHLEQLRSGDSVVMRAVNSLGWKSSSSSHISSSLFQGFYYLKAPECLFLCWSQTGSQQQWISRVSNSNTNTHTHMQTR